MDDFKKETVKGYTCEDLNAKCVHQHNRQKAERREKKKAKRKTKIMLDKMRLMWYNEDTKEERN